MDAAPFLTVAGNGAGCVERGVSAGTWFDGLLGEDYVEL